MKKYKIILVFTLLLLTALIGCDSTKSVHEICAPAELIDIQYLCLGNKISLIETQIDLNESEYGEYYSKIENNTWFNKTIINSGIKSNKIESIDLQKHNLPDISKIDSLALGLLNVLINIYGDNYIIKENEGIGLIKNPVFLWTSETQGCVHYQYIPYSEIEKSESKFLTGRPLIRLLISYTHPKVILELPESTFFTREILGL
jgi:hypothetical protein